MPLNVLYLIVPSYLEQKVDFARQLAQKFFIMEKGTVVANGATSDLSDDLVHKYLAI